MIRSGSKLGHDIDVVLKRVCVLRLYITKSVFFRIDLFITDVWVVSVKIHEARISEPDRGFKPGRAVEMEVTICMLLSSDRGLS